MFCWSCTEITVVSIRYYLGINLLFLWFQKFFQYNNLEQIHHIYHQLLNIVKHTHRKMLKHH